MTSIVTNTVSTSADVAPVTTGVPGLLSTAKGKNNVERYVKMM